MRILSPRHSMVMIVKKVSCSNCGISLMRSVSRMNENMKYAWRIYCSKKCQGLAFSRKVFLTCENVSRKNRFQRSPKKILVKNFCSSSCAAKVNNTLYPKRLARVKVCEYCTREFTGLGVLYCCLRCKQEGQVKYTKEELIEILKKTAVETGRTPAKRELREIANCCIRTFGSWSNAIREANLTVNRSADERMYKRKRVIAKDGHVCDSVSEAIVDNLLTALKVEHERNRRYPSTKHRADWKIEGRQIFMEYFGLAGDSRIYDATLTEKREICKKENISLIAIYPKDLYPKNVVSTKLKKSCLA